MREVPLEELKNEFEVEKKESSQKLHQKYIRDSKELIEEASDLIYKYQSGELHPIKFKRGWVNESMLGGLFPGNVVGIAGSSGHGKSTFLQDLEDDIFDKELNPDCDDYILLRNNYEMSVFKLYLRELKKGLDKKISEILGTNFSEEELLRVQQIQKKESNQNVKYFENPQDAETWFSIMCSFCEEHKNAKHIVVSIDHIALVKQTSLGKKDGIDNLVEYINLLRHIYKNVSFLILSQLNRNIEERDNPRNSAPRKGDLYQSDFLFQLSDIIIVVHNPFKLGLEEHMVIGQDMYKHLDYIKKDVGKKTTTFKTKGNIFYHLIKLREDENGNLSDLYIEKMYKNVTNYQKQEEEKLPRYEPNPDLFEDNNELYN